VTAAADFLTVERNLREKRSSKAVAGLARAQQLEDVAGAGVQPVLYKKLERMTSSALLEAAEER
jgi:hypothetical protein